MPVSTSALPDTRALRSGLPIPCEDYCDQPYVVQTDEGAWLCVMTTARGEEGARSQHIVATRSTDHGRTWSPLTDVEPPGPPESSYATILKTPYGRVYAFYNHNTANQRQVIAGTEYARNRVDTLGRFVFKFSDDGGRTWSPQRYEIPIRESRIDRENPYGGAVRFFWHVGRPLVHEEGAAYVTLHKVGRFGEGFMEQSEGWFLCSPNLLTERNPERIVWETLPDGDTGLTAPAGPIADENRAVALSDGSLYCTYRTTDGHPCHAYSRDNGHTWTPPAYMTYANGRPVKHPRAANFAWRCGNGKYLYWFHNHGGRGYEGRNPAWLCGGIEADGPDGKIVLWSQPEILLYDDEDPATRISYPDLIEENGRFWITETQKSIARVHEIAPVLLNGVWAAAQPKANGQPDQGLVLTLSGRECAPGSRHAMPYLSRLNKDGLSFLFTVRFETLEPGQVLLDGRDGQGRGVRLTLMPGGAIAVTLSDETGTACSWAGDPDMLETGRWHHVGVVLDARARLITFVLDGVLCDGGAARPCGWGRLTIPLRQAAHMDERGGGGFVIAPALHGVLGGFRVYDRYLLTSEAGRRPARDATTTGDNHEPTPSTARM